MVLKIQIEGTCAIIIVALLWINHVHTLPTIITTGSSIVEEDITITPTDRSWTEIEIEVTEADEMPKEKDDIEDSNMEDSSTSTLGSGIMMTAITESPSISTIHPEQIDDETTTMTTTTTKDLEDLKEEEMITTITRGVDELQDEESTDTNIDSISTMTTTPPPLDHLDHLDPDKKEIINELRDIWHYTEELGEDQVELKSSLSSLIHMTYARVYEQTDETLIRLKYLLRRLRARLLDPNKSTTTTTTTSTLDLNKPLLELESGTQRIPTIPSSSSRNYNYREKRSSNINILKSRMRSNRGYNYKYNASVIFALANPDENSLFPPQSTSTTIKEPVLDRFSYTMEQSNAVDGHKNKNQNHTILDDNNDGLVKVTITTLDMVNNDTNINKYKNLTTIPPLIEPVTLVSDNDSTTNTNINDDNDNEMTMTTLNPQEEEEEELSQEPTLTNIIQKIIEILRRPIQTPTRIKPISQLSLHVFDRPQMGLMGQDEGLDGVDNANSTIVDDLPSYIHKLALGMLDLPIESQNSSLIESTTDEINNNMTTTTDVDEPLIFATTPSNMLNGTMEKVLQIVSVYTNLPSASRLVLFFAVSISIVSIALGVYSLGPPIVVLGVLGIIMPVFLLFLFQSNLGKKRKTSKIVDNLLDNLKSEDFFKALDLLASAVEKYEGRG